MTVTDPHAILTVDLDAVAANWRTLRAEHPSGPVAAVLKADGYGLGAGPVSRRLYREGCRTFFTAHVTEAAAIAPDMPGATVAVLHGLGGGSSRAFVNSTPRSLSHARVVPVLGSLAEIEAWAGFGLPAMLHIDTGMNRLGLDQPALRAVRADPGRLAGIEWLCVMTHFVSSERPGDPQNAAQMADFADACAGLPAMPRSLANSSGVFLPAPSDLARPGAALFGVNPTPGRPNPMRGVVTLTAPVLSVRDVPAGTTVGYNGQWRAARASRIATVAVGYADGWLRSHANRGAARFDGKAVPLVGRVSMDMTTFDATDHPGLMPGARVELIGPGCPPDTVAEAAGTNGYEVLTALGRRYERRYLGA